MPGKTIVVGLAVVIVVSTVWALWGRNHDGEAQQEMQASLVVVTELKVAQTPAEGVPLEDDHIIVVSDDGQPQEIPVVLEWTVYQYTVVTTDEGQTKEHSGRIELYQLRSMDPEVPYSWTYWPGCKIRDFKLFPNGPGENYLACVVGSDIICAEVSQPRDARATLVQRYSGTALANAVDIPAGELIHMGAEWGLDAVYRDILIRSVTKDEGDRWVVEIANPMGQEFTIVGEGDNWHVDYRVQIPELTQIATTTQVSLEQSWMFYGAPGQDVKRIPVTLDRTIYDVRALVTGVETVDEWTNPLVCYELHSADPSVAYSFTFWVQWVPESDRIPGVHYTWLEEALRLLSNDKGYSFITVSYDRFVGVMDVSEGNDKTEALREFLWEATTQPQVPEGLAEKALRGAFSGYGAGRLRLVPVVPLFHIWPFAYPTGPAHITVKAVLRDNGDLIVQVSGIKSDKVYSLIFDGENWRKE